MMKLRRIVCMLLALTLAFSLLPGVGASGELFFVAVNDTIPLTLSDLPFTSGSTVYVPYSVFDLNPGGVAAGYDAKAQTLILFTRDKHLIFDAAAGTVVDEKGNASGSAAIYMGGVLYVPLVLCASYFGLTASLLESADGHPVLRFTTGSEVYDNDLFIQRAENLIAYRIAQSASGATSDFPPDLPDPPSQTDDPAEEDPHEPATVYLAFVGANRAEDTMDALAAYHLRGTFFFTADEILTHRALVRTLIAEGHLLGVTCPTGSTDVQSELLLANDAMDDVLQTRSVMALLPADRADEADGFRVFSPEGGLAAADAAADPSMPHLLVCPGDAGAMLATLSENGAAIPLLCETTSLP